MFVAPIVASCANPVSDGYNMFVRVVAGVAVGGANHRTGNEESPLLAEIGFREEVSMFLVLLHRTLPPLP